MGTCPLILLGWSSVGLLLITCGDGSDLVEIGGVAWIYFVGFRGAQSWIFLCKATYPWLICGVGSEEICFAWISVEKKCIVAVRMGARWSSKIVG